MTEELRPALFTKSTFQDFNLEDFLKYLDKGTRLNASKVLRLKDKRYLKDGETLFLIHVNYQAYQDIRNTYNILSDLEGLPSFEKTFLVPDSAYDSRQGVFKITTHYSKTLVQAVYANIHGIPKGMFTDYRNKWRISFDYLAITCTKTITKPYPERDMDKVIVMYGL